MTAAITILLEIILAALIAGLLLFLLRVKRSKFPATHKGWNWIIVGFSLLLFASLIDITDNFDSLNRYVVIGDTPARAFLEEFVGYFGGFLALAIGLMRWIPSVQELAEEITERKRAEVAFKKSEESYRAIFEGSGDPIMVIDRLDGHFLDANQEACLLLEYSRDELLSMGVPDIHPHDLGAAMDLLDQVERHGKYRTDVLTCRTRSGKMVPADIHGSILEIAGKPVVLARIRDVSKRKRAENLLRDAIGSLEEGFSLWDADDRLVLCNEKYRNSMSGITDILKPGLKFEDMIRTLAERRLRVPALGREEEWIQERMEQRRKPGKPFDMQFSDGRWFRIQESKTRDGGTVTIRTDITENKLAEEALRESEVRLRLVTDSIPAAITYMDSGLRYRFANKRYGELHGIDTNDIIGKHLEEMIGEELFERTAERRNAVMAGEEQHFEETMADGSGDVRHVQAAYVPHFGEDGRVQGYYALIQDITQRKRAEEAHRESEDRFRAVVENLPASIVIKDLNFRNLIANKKYCEWLGTDHESIVGKTVHEYLSKDDADKVAAQERKVRDTGLVIDEERRVTYPDGITRDVFAQKFPIPAADGSYAAIGTVIADITDRKRVEETLRVSEERFKGILEIAGEGIVSVNEEHRITMFNSGAEKIFGHRAAEVLGRPLETLIPERFHGGHERLLREFTSSPAASRLMAERGGIYGLRKDGSEFPAEASISRLRLEGETVYTVMIRDVTESRKAEEELRLAKDTAEVANQAKTEFLANMSHELRTPLNSIIGFSDILSAEMFGPLGLSRYVNYAGDINVSGKHLLDLINDILDVSRIETDNLSLEENMVDVNRLLPSCLRLFAERADKAGLALKLEIPDELPALYADERRVKQIVLNLLANSIKFTLPGGTVIIKARVDGEGRLSCAVSDTGEGIAPENINLVMTPFGQADGTLVRTHDGVGLGLPLAKSLAELHGGSLTLESTPGEGTTVTVTFPAERVINAAAE